MSRPIRAIYEGGHLRLLDPVELAEGEEVRVAITHLTAASADTPARSWAEMTEDERFRAALGDSVRFPTPRPPDDDFDEEAVQRELDEALKGLPPVSEYIIRERREEP